MNKFYEIQIEYENQCLLNCMHCSSLDMRQQEKINFDLNDIIDLLKILNCNTHIYLTGGEPLLNLSLIYNIIDIKNKVENTEIGLFTTGILKNKQSINLEYAQNLINAGVNDCYISLYHNDSEIHNIITKMTDSYEITTKAIKNLLNVGIEVKIHLVLNKFNINYLDSVINEISKLGVNEIRLLRLIRTGNAVLNWDEIGVSYKLQDDEIHKIINKLNNYNIKITISGFPDFCPCRPFKNSQKCQAGTNLLYITYEGNIFPCACTKNISKYFIGHITEHEKIISYVKNKLLVECNDTCLNPIK